MASDSDRPGKSDLDGLGKSNSDRPDEMKGEMKVKPRCQRISLGR